MRMKFGHEDSPTPEATAGHGSSWKINPGCGILVVESFGSDEILIK